ncbi:MAG: prepilin-type N-terminal cleavage/methylation domain-containing protein [Spirochaetes bacterium]|nr:prepilin-type N-terminal cleavage/methylation domain-containing protein [Spirochaetota bacterium]
MRKLNQQMKYLKNTISMKMSNGFSLIEMVISISVTTLLFTSIMGASFALYRGFIRAKENSVKIEKMSRFYEMLFLDVLNPDIFPHHPSDQYVLEEKSIVFFANGGNVEYKYIDDGLLCIQRDKEAKHFSFIKDFNIKYYDKNEFEIFDIKEFPCYCEMKFIFYDKKEISIEMRL